LGNLSKALLLGQFVCGYSSWAVCLCQFFLSCTSAAVLLGLLGCTSMAVILGLLGCTSMAVILGLFACSCSSVAIPMSGQFLLLGTSLVRQEVLVIVQELALVGMFDCGWLFDICGWLFCLQMAVCCLQMVAQHLWMAVPHLQMAV